MSERYRGMGTLVAAYGVYEPRALVSLLGSSIIR